MKTWINDLWLYRLELEIKEHTLPMLYVPGMHEGGWIFLKNWLPATKAAGFDGWALNLRGHHGSRPVKNIGKISLQDYARDIEDIVDHIGPCILIGKSMGGLASQLVAARRPEVRGLVLLSSTPPRGILAGDFTSLLAYLKPRYVVPSILHKPLLPHKQEIWRMVLNKIPSENEKDYIFSRLVVDSGHVTQQISLGLISVDYKKITCPVLVIGASHDKLMPPRIQQAIARKHPRGEYIEFPGGHMLPIEQGWQAPIKKILEWVVEVVE